MDGNNATVVERRGVADTPPALSEMLRLVIDGRGSDLHITADSTPVMRVDGVLTALPFPALSAHDTKTLCYSVLTEGQRRRFEQDLELDFAFGIRGLSRFRGNLFRQRGAVAAAFRLVPASTQPLAALGLPLVVGELTKLPRGLVLVTGATGSGKSTTLAAMIDKVNAERRKHIVTLEDPIEFVHQHRCCLVNQREVSVDTHSFSDGLRHVLRQDPDVVLIGEVRDLDTISSALTVDETGHLVLSTLHTNSAVQTIHRIIDVFPTDQQPQVRAQLSLVLQGVIAQQLIPRCDGPGRVLAVEVMIPNLAIRNLIREAKVHQIYSLLQVGRGTSGMQTMTQSLLDLYQQKCISRYACMEYATEPDELRSLMK